MDTAENFDNMRAMIVDIGDRLLKWNHKKIQELSPKEIWFFILGRVLLAFGFGILAMKYAPEISSGLDLPAIIAGLIFLAIAAKGILR